MISDMKTTLSQNKGEKLRNPKQNNTNETHALANEYKQMHTHTQGQEMIKT